MALREGEVYKCPDAACGCEVAVTKTPAAGMGGDEPPRCCCDKAMVKK